MFVFVLLGNNFTRFLKGENMLKNLKVVFKTKQFKMVYKLNLKSKIIRFVKRRDSYLSDADINALILGVVNLIKNNTIKKIENSYKKQIVHYQDLLSLNMSRMVKLEHELKKLKGK